MNCMEWRASERERVRLKGSRGRWKDAKKENVKMLYTIQTKFTDKMDFFLAIDAFKWSSLNKKDCEAKLIPLLK